VSCGHDASLPESGCIAGAITGHVRAYLGDPFLSSQVPGYLRDTSRPNLKLLTAGRRAADLMAARHAVPFELLLQRLERVFDVVLVDAPPAALHTPTASLGRAVDGVLLVVRAGRFEAAEIRRAIDGLERAGGRILGVVLTDAVLPRESGLSAYYRVPVTGRGHTLSGSRT
jgi:Mrp family chromosome partitioning ATPase